MLITTTVDLKIQGPTIKYYKDLGYNVKVGMIITIPIEHLNKKSHIKVKIKCDVCDEEKESFYFAYNKYLSKSTDGKYRCGKCNGEIRKKTCLEKYGTESPMQSNEIKEKRTELFLDKYGVEHYNKLDIFKEKRKNTNLEKYDAESPMQNEAIKNKQLKTIFDKFGVKCSLQNKNVHQKTLKTMNNKYGVNYSMQNDDIKQKITKHALKTKIEKIINNNTNIIEINNNNYLVKCDICNEIYEINSHLYYQRKKQKSIQCVLCNPIGNKYSGKELQLLNFIKENYSGEIIENSRNIINPFELDIYLPDLNLAFEFNGLYWHSELYKDKDYHLKKTQACFDKEIKLFHVWEDDWDIKRNIIKSMILNMLCINKEKIIADCVIKEINNTKLVKDFLNKSHILGFIKSSVKIGLFYKDDLVSLMTFIKTKDNSYILSRFCNKLYIDVLNSRSKIFNYFIKNYNFNEIITYVDRNESDLYEMLGFNLINNIKPNHYFIINGVRKNKNTIKNKNNKIYDGGLLKFQFNKLKKTDSTIHL